MTARSWWRSYPRNSPRDWLTAGNYENFVIAPPERGGHSFEAIRMTAEQCKLVAMRESKGVRRWVLNRLKELE